VIYQTDHLKQDSTKDNYTPSTTLSYDISLCGAHPKSYQNAILNRCYSGCLSKTIKPTTAVSKHRTIGIASLSVAPLRIIKGRLDGQTLPSAMVYPYEESRNTSCEAKQQYTTSYFPVKSSMPGRTVIEKLATSFSFCIRESQCCVANYMESFHT
jgi:hypothetical protein